MQALLNAVSKGTEMLLSIPVNYIIIAFVLVHVAGVATLVVIHMTSKGNPDFKSDLKKS
jgi:hypothetical protein